VTAILLHPRNSSNLILIKKGNGKRIDGRDAPLPLRPRTPTGPTETLPTGSLTRSYRVLADSPWKPLSSRLRSDSAVSQRARAAMRIPLRSMSHCRKGPALRRGLFSPTLITHYKWPLVARFRTRRPRRSPRLSYDGTRKRSWSAQSSQCPLRQRRIAAQPRRRDRSA
jgi:hypothetical protein